MRRSSSQGLLPIHRRDPSTALGVTEQFTMHDSRLLCHVERRATGPKSRHLDNAEHSPLRITTALAISPSSPLDFARGDSLCRHVERRGLGPEVETSRLDGAFTIATRTGSRPSDRRDSSTAPALGMTITSVTLSGATAKSKGLDLSAHSPSRPIPAVRSQRRTND